MPFVAVNHCEGAFTREQQHQLIRDITDAFVRIGGPGIRPTVIVTITEVADGLWGSGGEVLDLAAIQQMRAERAAAAR